MRYYKKSGDTWRVITLFGVRGRLKLQIVAQGIDVNGKCFFAFLCHAAGGAWLFTGKTFFDGDVACFGKFFELYAQVAGSCLCLLLDVNKVGLGSVPLHYIFAWPVFFSPTIQAFSLLGNNFAAVFVNYNTNLP